MTLQRWRQELGCLLQRGNRHVWSAAMGSVLPGNRTKSQSPSRELVDLWRARGPRRTRPPSLPLPPPSPRSLLPLRPCTVPRRRP